MIKVRRLNLMFCDKKAIEHDLFFNVLELVLAIIVIVSLFSFVNKVSDQTIFEEKYVARDLALLVNTINAAPGDVDYSYKTSSDLGFDIDFDDNLVMVRNVKGEDKGREIGEVRGEGLEKAMSYPFAKNLGLDFRYGDVVLEATRDLQLIKTENKFEIN